MSEDCSLASMEEAWLEQGDSNNNDMCPSNNNNDYNNDGTAPISSVTENKSNFRPFVLTPIHEVPTRSRLHTAETDLIQNFKKSMNSAMAAAVVAPTATASRRNDFPSSFQDDDFPRDEASSVVSSLSKDDSLLARPPIMSSSDHVGATSSPPTEVSIPCDTPTFMETTPEWLSLQETCSSSSADVARPNLARDVSAPARLMAHNSFQRTTSSRGRVHVRTVLQSPKILRPTHGRNHSCPRMDFSIATHDSSGCSLDALFADDGTKSNRSMSPDSMKLVGNRKRRTPKSSTIASTGHGSSTTVPTVASSSSMTAGSKQSEDDSMSAARSSMRKRNVVKEELKYVMNLVSTPILKLPLLKKVDSGSSVDLTRAHGCLT
jgi:hypothetical protein